MLSFLFRLLPALACMLLSMGCSSPPPNADAVRRAASDSFWIGDRVDGKPRMVISLSQQRLFYFKGDRLVGASPISSGRQPGWTKTGSFRISEKDIDHRSSAYGSYVTPDGIVVDDDVDSRTDPKPPGTIYKGAEMHYFMRIVGAIGMHQGYLPGYPASHGCIRLPGRMAAIFFHATPLGTPVVVTQGPVAVREPPASVVEERQVVERAPAPPQRWVQQEVVRRPSGVVRSSQRQSMPRAPKLKRAQRGATIYLE